MLDIRLRYDRILTAEVMYREMGYGRMIMNDRICGGGGG
jgi:hypothetical protein